MRKMRRTARAKAVREADKWFALYIKERDKWTCQRCQKKYPKRSRGLHCSHFFGRTMFGTRWDERDCDSLCYGCHRYWEKEDREAYRTFKIKQLGESIFNLLDLTAHTKLRVDPYVIAKAYESLMNHEDTDNSIK